MFVYSWEHCYQQEKDSFSLEDGKFDFYEKFLTDFLMCLRRPCKQKLSFLPGREIQKYDFAMKMFSDFLYWIQVQEVQVHFNQWTFIYFFVSWSSSEIPDS